MPNQYAQVRKERKKLGTPKTDMWIEPTPPEPAVAPPVNGSRPEVPKHGKDSLSPEHLLNEENHYDRNTYTPEHMQKRIGPHKPDLTRT